MLSNYLAAAFRNFGRNRLYSVISVGGLAVGLAAALLIALFVRNELGYERFRPHYERTYLVSETLRISGASPIVVGASPAELAAWAKADIASIEAIARLMPNFARIRRGELQASDEVFWADANLFDVLPMRAIAGDVRTALAQPGGVVLTRAMARKYFGLDAPLDEVLEVGPKALQLRVRAVIEDIPLNTHLYAQIFAAGATVDSPLAEIDARAPPLMGGNNAASVFTYLRLAPGADAAQVQQQIDAMVARRAPRAAGMRITFPVHAIADVHLRPELGGSTERPAGTMTTVYAVSAVAVLILLVAVINVVNLITARAMRRALEVGVRKAAGATRVDLVLQFVGEAFLYVASAMLLAIALAELLVPRFNAFLGRGIAFSYADDPLLLLGVLAGTLVLSALTGIYPALVLSAFRPAAIMKGRSTAGGTGSAVTRHLLVAAQFAVLIGLLLATAVIYRQTRFALQDGLRFGTDPILLVEGGCSDTFRDAVAALPGVRDAACSLSAPTMESPSQSNARLADGTNVLLWFASADAGFFELYGLKPVAGRFLSREHESDLLLPESDAPEALVVNETAVRRMKFASAEAAVGQVVRCGHSLSSPDRQLRGRSRSCVIIGVAPDFSSTSIRRPIEPSAWYRFPEQFTLLNVRLRGQHVPETLRAIDELWKQLGGEGAFRRTFLEERVQSQYADIIRQGQILAAFSAVAVLIGCLGLFGLSAFNAERRTREIGVRKAMGAATSDIVRLLAWQFSQPVLWANLVAWPVAAWLMSRWLQGFAYHIELEPWLFAAASGVVLAIALLTVSTHCVLAARVRPAVSLRAE